MKVKELIEQLSQIHGIDLEAEVVIDVEAEAAFYGFPEVESIDLLNNKLYLKGQRKWQSMRY